MTQQDYEQKKRECWEEYVNMLNRNCASRYVFDKIFDRAYALGREKETISQEDVEKASMKYRDAHYDKFYDSLHNDSRTWDALEHVIIASFISGAQFSLGKQEEDAVTNEEIEKLSFEFAEDKKWHDFNDLRSRARLLRQFTAFLLKKYTIQTK